MKKVMAAIALASVCAVPSAFAGEANWAGPYAGVTLGMSSYSSQFVDIDDEWDNQGQNGESTTEFVPSLMGGWNFESEGLVTGVELSYSLGGPDSSSKPYGQADIGLMQTELKSVIALKARVGVAVGSSLPYVTAGFARGEFDSAYNTSVGGPNENFSDDADGLTYGVGVEHQFLKNLVGRFQVDATDFETVGPSRLGNGNTISSSSSMQGFSLAVAYKFF